MPKSRRERRIPIPPLDLGPPERSTHHRVVVERDVHNRPRLRIIDQLDIDRLLLDRKISLDQHSAAEHLFGLLQYSGFLPACKWVLDSNIRGEVQAISERRSDALLKLGLAKSWLIAKAGRAAMELTIQSLLGERRVQDRYLPLVRKALNEYQDFEAWWIGQDVTQPLPTLLANLPRKKKPKATRPLHNKVG